MAARELSFLPKAGTTSRQPAQPFDYSQAASIKGADKHSVTQSSNIKWSIFVNIYFSEKLPLTDNKLNVVNYSCYEYNIAG